MISKALALVIGSAIPDHLHVRVDIVDAVRCGLDLRAADVLVAVQELALQVGDVHGVEIDDAQRAHAGCGQVHRRGAAQPAGADEEHLALQQLDLAGLAHFLEQGVAAVAQPLFLVQHGGDGEAVAGILPAVEAADEGIDVGVAHLLEVTRGQRRADAAGAVEHHRRLALDLV